MPRLLTKKYGYIRFLFLNTCGDNQDWFMEPKTGVELAVYSGSQNFRVLGNRKLAVNKDYQYRQLGKPTTRLSYVKYRCKLTTTDRGNNSYLIQTYIYTQLYGLKTELSYYFERTLINVCKDAFAESTVVHLAIDIFARLQDNSDHDQLISG